VSYKEATVGVDTKRGGGRQISFLNLSGRIEKAHYFDIHLNTLIFNIKNYLPIFNSHRLAVVEAKKDFRPVFLEVWKD